MNHHYQTRLDRQVFPSAILDKVNIVDRLAVNFEQQFQSPFPKLALVAECYFNMSEEDAYKAHCNSTLPVNVYRLGGRKSTKVISVLELAHYAYEQLLKEGSL
mgnify:CR=1 FL=1